jgi:hypothetical protein
MDKVSKQSVFYRRSGTFEKCGNCSMYRKDTALEGRCTLVMGTIRADYVCDEWEQKK